MIPASSRRRTRSSVARGDSATACASFWMVERPSRCSAARILTSMRSNAGGRFAAIAGLNLVGHGHRVVQAEPAAVGVDSLPRDIARFGRGEEDRDGRDLVGIADAPERRARENPPLRLLV